jgi:hypothetical protein
MTISVSEIDLKNKKQVRQFVQFPFQLYRGNPYWVPPLLSEAYRALDPQRHFAYKDSQADFFLAEKDGMISGRIAAFFNARHAHYTGKKTASFSFFDCVDDSEVSQALFGSVARWAEQRGMVEMIGPRGLTTLDGSGVLVEGFEHRAALNMPYNYPYYDNLIKNAGFERVSDSLSGYLPGDYELPERVKTIAQKVMERRGITIKSFTTKKEMREWIPRVAETYQKAFSVRPDYIPLMDEEIQAQGDALIAIADPRLIKLVMKGDEVIGFVFAYHDISPALQKSGGRLFPLGWLYIVQEQKKADWVNINGLGLVPEHQRVGGDAILFSELEKSIKSFGFKHADIVTVEDTNLASRNDIEALGVQWYKAHRNYRKVL